MGAYVALLHRDLVTIARSWVARGWLVLSALAAAVAVLGQSTQGLPASQVAAQIQLTFLFLWSIFVIVIGASAVAPESGVLADSVLSRPVTRSQYILAKLTARSFAVLVVFVSVAGGSAYATWRYSKLPDVSFADVSLGVVHVLTALLFLVAVSVAMSSVMRTTFVAIVALVLAWYSVGALFEFLNVSFLSPFELRTSLPECLRGELDADLLWKIPLGFGIPTVAVWLATLAYFNYKDL
ncbi:MAG TPA: hypothetical protein PLD23_10205 [Armatimonadota bacterium]|nr:hypothetical protein [Armatimonadota bacterium]HQK93867.1 hypothetical protein [Armatimonadota bacterium]